MSKITKSAKGKPCTLRVSGYGGCSDPETVVFCHAPSNGKGTGKKSPDWWGAFACQKCHDLMDNRTKIDVWRGNGYSSRHLNQAEKNEAWNRGIYETHQILIAEGLIQVAE